MKLPSRLIYILPFVFGVMPVAAFCVGTWTQKTPTAAPSARVLPCMAFDAQRGVTVLFSGGTTSGTNFNETWEWDGSNWTQEAPIHSPSPRLGTAMVFDSKRGVIVLFGGNQLGAFLGDTWEWNGSDWTERSPATSPPARNGHGMAFDEARGVTVLFGGATSGAGGIVGDTWEWDGTNWTQVSPAVSPPGRCFHAMTYDNRRQVSVIFGGNPDNVAALADTWEFDGTTWSMKSSAEAPSARMLHNMTFDSSKNVTVLFGGRAFAGSPNNESWEWDGVSWFQRNALTPPPARSHFGMAYDIQRGVSAIFGGSDSANHALGDTWVWSGPTPLITQQPADQSVVAGASATFTVAASGQDGQPNPLPLTFQWRKGGTALSDGGHIAGSNTATLTVSPAESGDAGQYDCLVQTCAFTTSRAATLDPCKPASAADDCDGNGRLDSCDIAADPSLDANGNGVIDSCEPAAADQTPSENSGDSQSVATAAPCGTCGGGAAGMMPLALLSIMGLRRTRR